MKTMKAYHLDMYLKYDVFLLTNVFEKFRNNSLKNVGLCPSHYLSASVLNWDAMLKTTKIKKINIYIYIICRCSKAKNKYLISYDSKQESKHIIYLDANNLYAYEMSKFPETCRFKRIDPKESDLNIYTINSSKGCVLEAYLEYLKELQELHNDYSLALDKIEIKREMLYECPLKIADLNNISIGNDKK